MYLKKKIEQWVENHDRDAWEIITQEELVEAILDYELDRKYIFSSFLSEDIKEEFLELFANSKGSSKECAFIEANPNQILKWIESKFTKK